MKWGISPLAAGGLLMIFGINVWPLAVLVTEIVSDNQPYADKVEWNVNVSAPAGNTTSRRSIDAYHQILARPALFKTRTPFVPAPPPPPQVSIAQPAPVVVDPGLVLGGVMIKNDHRKAYVSSRASTGGGWVNEGGEFMGWQLKSVDGDGARLEQNGRSIELQLYPKQ